MKRDDLWLIGEDVTPRRLAWVYHGVAGSREAARRACKSPAYFIAPARLDEQVSDYTPPLGEREYPLGDTEGGATMVQFEGRLGFDSEVRIARSSERGAVCAVVFDKRLSAPRYFVEYTTPDGCAAEGWFYDDDLSEVRRGE